MKQNQLLFQPRLIRLTKAPQYLGMNIHCFNAYILQYGRPSKFEINTAFKKQTPTKSDKEFNKEVQEILVKRHRN